MKKGVLVSVMGAVFALIILFLILFISPFNNTDNSATDELVVYTPHPTAFVQPLVEEYERRTNNRVRIIYGGTGELEKQILSGQEIDLMWGGSYYSVNQYRKYFADYWTPNELYYLDENKNNEGNMTRFTDMPSVLIVNTDLIGDIPVSGYRDLLNPQLKGQIAFADPIKSSSAFEHLINMVYACSTEEEGSEWDYIRQLYGNIDGQLLSSSSEVYNGVADGKFVVGLTFEEAAAGLIEDGRHVKIVYMEEGVVSTPDGIYLLESATHPEEAKRFIDFLTGYDAQYLITRQLGRRSVRRDIPEPKGLAAKDEIYMLHPKSFEIIRNRDNWIEQFKEICQEESHEK